MPAGQLLILVAFFAIFWFLLIRPQRNRQKQLQQLQSQLSVGDTVMLTSGIFGTVRDTSSDAHIVVEVADGVELKVLRGAIGQVVPEATDEIEESDVEGEDVEGSTEDVESADETADVDETVDASEETVDASGDRKSGGSATGAEEK